jgi:hypothetical protein
LHFPTGAKLHLLVPVMMHPLTAMLPYLHPLLLLLPFGDCCCFPLACFISQARAAAADEESRLVRSAERLRRLQEVQRQQQALEQAGASALQGVKRAQEEAARQRAETEARLRQQQEEERRKREAEAAEQAAAAKAAEEVRCGLSVQYTLCKS